MLTEKLTRPSRQWLLLALMVGLAVALALSMAFAGDAQAKKHKKHHHRGGGGGLNTVQCDNTSIPQACVGTSANDHLLAIDNGGQGDELLDQTGDDIFEIPLGASAPTGTFRLLDISLTSNDTYKLPSNDFGRVEITDLGGTLDILDLSAYNLAEFTPTKCGGASLPDLCLTSTVTTDNRKVTVRAFFTPQDSIDIFKFKDQTLTDAQMVALTP
jgi:hypothetical protein